MPLFNPSTGSSANAKRIQLIEQVYMVNSDGNSTGFLVSVGEPNKVFTSISNPTFNDFDILVGYEIPVNPQSYAAIIKPGGTYETPYGYNGDIFCTAPANKGVVIASFEEA